MTRAARSCRGWEMPAARERARGIIATAVPTTLIINAITDNSSPATDFFLTLFEAAASGGSTVAPFHIKKKMFFDFGRFKFIYAYGGSP